MKQFPTTKAWLSHYFIEYAKIDTQSDPNASSVPSTAKQFDLANLLFSQLKEWGAHNVLVSENCYVYATIPANVQSASPLPTIGLVAHMDTSHDVAGAPVRPRVIERYQGGRIPYEANPELELSEATNPELANCYGHTLITSDGLTLLGADDKAGVAAIMKLAHTLLTEPQTLLHGPIEICFTPDEEVGRGTEFLDFERFACDLAYTIDGGGLGILNKETFNAHSATITIHGKEIHPGSAKNIMVNSIRVAGDLISALPKEMAPETTAGKEGFIHPVAVESSIGKTLIRLILRDFDAEKLQAQHQLLKQIIADAQKMHPRARIELNITESYKNMLHFFAGREEVLTRLEDAATQIGITPYWEAIRGGTDGARISEKGIPCPNIFMGGANYHGLNEWLSVDVLEQTVHLLMALVQNRPCSLAGREKS